MEATSIHRLLPDDDLSWALFPEFRRRVRKFVADNLPSTEPESVVYDVTTKWTSLPLTTGYWMVLTESETIGHIASWINEVYGRPLVFIYQAKIDEGHDGNNLQHDVFREMDSWVDKLNALIPDGRPKITKGEMSTWRNAEAFARYIGTTGRPAAKVRSVVEFDLGSGAPKLVL